MLTIFFSEYKEEEEVCNRCFVTKELAEVAMKNEARRLYKQSGIIQEADNKYFEESENRIDFGESWGESDYRREYGYCQIERVKLEVEVDVFASTDEEDEDSDD